MSVGFIYSIIYVVSVISVFICFFRFRKSDHILNGVTWSAVTVTITICWIALVAGIISIIHIPVNLISLSICNYFLLGLCLYTQKNKPKQSLKWNKWDIIAIIVITVLALSVCLYQHTGTLRIRYFTGDPSTHLKYALKIFDNSSVRGDMFFSPLNNALLIAVLSPFIKAYQYYKVMILSDICMLILAGVTFYGVICEKVKKGKHKACALVLSIIYVMGYPLNNKALGFFYLGISVTIIMVLCYICDLYINDRLYHRVALFVMMLLCFGVPICYMLFSPIVYFSVLGCIIYRHRSKVLALDTVKDSLAVFLIPTALALYYCLGFFFSEGTTVADSLSVGGGIYGEVYANYLFLLPFVISAIIYGIRRKKNISYIVFLMIFTVSVIGMIFLVFADKMSIYYFYKFQHPMWLFVCVLCYYGILESINNDKIMSISYGVVVLGVVLLYLFGFDVKWTDMENEKCNEGKSPTFFSIGFEVFTYNKTALQTAFPYSSDKIDLYYYVYNHCRKDGKPVPILAGLENYIDCFWYEDISRQNMKDYYIWNDIDISKKFFKNKKIKYVTVLYESPLYAEYCNKIETYKKVYENPVGCIIKIR